MQDNNKLLLLVVKVYDLHSFFAMYMMSYKKTNALNYKF